MSNRSESARTNVSWTANWTETLLVCAVPGNPRWAPDSTMQMSPRVYFCTRSSTREAPCRGDPESAFGCQPHQGPTVALRVAFPSVRFPAAKTSPLPEFLTCLWSLLTALRAHILLGLSSLEGHSGSRVGTLMPQDRTSPETTSLMLGGEAQL